jgi:hypothetical protein
MLALSFGALIVYFTVVASASGASIVSGYSADSVTVRGSKYLSTGRPSMWRNSSEHVSK